MKLSNFAKKVILPMLCMMALAPLAHADAPNETSTATVGFTEGTLTLSDPSDTHVNFDFLMHDLPFAIPESSADYPYPSAENIEAYSLVITDARSANDPWMLQAAMTPFVHEAPATSNAFNGIVHLENGQKAFTYGTPDSNMTIVQNLQLISGERSALPVITLENGGLSRDEYTVRWDPAEVSLSFTDDTNVSTLIQGVYEATITWTIVTDIGTDNIG